MTLPFARFPATTQDFLIGAVILLVAAILFWPASRAPGLPMDEGVLLVAPERMTKGDLPYRDFHLTKGPGNVAILAATYSIFGASIRVERAVGLGYRLLLLAGIYGIGLKFGRTSAITCAAVAVVLLS